MSKDVNNIKKVQAGSELGLPHLKLGFDFTLIVKTPTQLNLT